MRPAISFVFAAFSQLRYTHSAPTAPTNGTLIRPVAVYYCPFDVQADLAGDLSSVTINYSASALKRSLLAQEKVTCYVRVLINFQPQSNMASVTEIQYKGHLRGEGQGIIETKTVWDTNWGPVRAACRLNKLLADEIHRLDMIRSKSLVRIV
jgi:hypothetical protein